MPTNTISKKSLHILEISASDDIEQVIVINLFKTWYNYIELMILYKTNWWWPQVHNEFEEYEIEIQVQSS